MATKFHKFTGVGEWFKIFVPDEYDGAKRWTLNFKPDNLEEWKASGIMLRDVKNNPGWFRPRRDCVKLIKGEAVNFEAPVVVNSEGVEWDSNEMGYIGNGSKVELTIAVFDLTARKGKGHRLEKIRILDLVEYQKPLTENQKEEEKTEPSVAKKKLPF